MIHTSVEVILTKTAAVQGRKLHKLLHEGLSPSITPQRKFRAARAHTCMSLAAQRAHVQEDSAQGRKRQEQD